MSDAAAQKDKDKAPPPRKEITLRRTASIVPQQSVQGRALLAVIVIMSFLACLTIGAVSMIRSTASSWASQISREITIQIKPDDTIDMEKTLIQVRDLALSFVGTRDGQILDKEATSRLLEPWLGAGLDIDELPVPRLVVITIDDQNPPDFTAMRAELKRKIPQAYLDDHRTWVDRLVSMARTTVFIGSGVLGLVFFAMVLTVIFATRGALAGNRHIVEVLHFVGAESSFVAREFQKHFLMVSLKGSLAGAFLAAAMFTGAAWWQSERIATPEADQAAALFGSFTIDWTGYVGIFLTMVIIAALTTVTARFTVMRTIDEIDHIRSDPGRLDQFQG
ncbi:cell division protein FtsX [Rhizobium sp. LjRoot254]|uniref:cell division protein FtsX n=1 Tax=Rhizobium sp. LjRoot254 TaxID=3342297 RepID=UPI003ECFBC78